MEEQEYGRAVQLFRAMDRLRRAWQGVTPCPELSKSQFGTLMVLRYRGRPPRPDHQCAPEESMTLSALATVMGQSLPALSRRVSALEEMGYVERVPNPSDRRVASVRLTQSGHALLDRAQAQLRRELGRAMDALGAQETETMLQLLGRLADVLEKTAADKARGSGERDEQC